MSALSLVTTPPKKLAEAVTGLSRLEPFRSLAGPPFPYHSFYKPSVQRATPAPVSPRMNALSGIASCFDMGTSPSSALDLSGIPGTGRFLF